MFLLLTAAFMTGDTFVVHNKMPQTFEVRSRIATAIQTVTHRAPRGHTHTCRNGHTWDHSVTSSHNCPTCGLYQNIQDRVVRPVTIIQTRPAVSATPVRTTAPMRLPATSLSGGCANGNCAYVR